MHAWQQEEGFVPDIQTMGKALSGGYASIGAVLASHEVCRVIEEKAGAFAHGFTFQGQPSTCAAALEVIGTIQDENLLENVCKIGELLDKGLKDELATHKHVGDIRGRGAFWAVS
jgi:adenosylmethionine-8-amino-7-oxononanoate aminotransferase